MEKRPWQALLDLLLRTSLHPGTRWNHSRSLCCRSSSLAPSSSAPSGPLRRFTGSGAPSRSGRASTRPGIREQPLCTKSRTESAPFRANELCHSLASRCSPRTRSAATTARTPGCGPPCFGSAGSIARSAFESGGDRTPSCCLAGSNARTTFSPGLERVPPARPPLVTARPNASTRACRSAARRPSPPPGRTPQAER